MPTDEALDPDSQSDKKLKQKAFEGASWQGVSTVLRAFSHYGSVIVMARFVTPEEYGTAAFGFIVINLSMVLINAGLGPALVQSSQITGRHIRSAFTVNAALSIVIYVILCVARHRIADYFNEPNLIAVLPVVGIAIIARGMAATSQALLQRELKFQQITFVNIASHVIGYAVIGIALAVMGAGYWAYIYASVSFAVFKLSFLLLAKPHSMVPRLHRVEISELGHFGLGLTLSRLFNFLGKSSDTLVVGRVLGTAALGVYEQAFKLVFLPSTNLSKIVDSVMFPIMSRVKDQPVRMTEAFKQTMSFANLMILPVIAFAALLTYEIVVGLVGPQWGGAVAPMKLLFAAAWLRTVMNVCDVTIRAKGAVYRSASRKCIYAVLITLFAIIGTRWGILGVALSVNLAVLLTTIMMLHLTLKLLDYRPHWNDVRVFTPGILVAAITLISAWTGKRLALLWMDNPLGIAVISGTWTAIAVTVAVGLAPARLLGPTLQSNVEQAIGKLRKKMKKR